MNTLIIFLKSFYQNIEFIAPIFGIFILTGIVGYILYKSVIKEENELILLPAGMITGVLSFILFLALFSYFFKGPTGILIILTLFCSTGYFFYSKFRIRITPNFGYFFKPSRLPVILIVLSFLGFFLFTAGNNVYGGDVIAYWGFATSFANGNYPVHSPWQPDLLAAHHQGTFLYEGAIQSITNANIKLIHSLYSFMIISSGFFLLWGWVRKQTGQTFLSLIPSMVLYISLGAFFIPLPIALRPYLNPEVDHEVRKLPIMTDFKNRLGGSSNLNELFYINHRATAFAGLLLIFIIACTSSKIDQKWKPLLLAALIIPTISADEVVLPAFGTGLSFWWISLLKHQTKSLRKKTLMFSGFALIAFIGLFFLTGSALRDAILIPASQPRFFLITDPAVMIGRFNELAGAILTYKQSGFILYLPDLRLITIATMILGFITKNRWSNLLLIASGGTLLAMLITEHTFYPGNHGRFLHLIYLLVGTAFSLNLLLLFKERSLLKKSISGAVILLLILPPIVTAQIYLLKNAKASEYPNFQGILPDYKVLAWAKKNISEKRIFFLDGYLKGVSYSYLTLNGIQDFGLKVPVSPAFIKVHTPDFGFESIDVISSLDAESIKDLKIDFVFIAHDQLSTLPIEAVANLKNTNLFQIVYSDDLGKLYSVSDAYKNLQIKPGRRVRDFKYIIPSGSNIYLDSPPQLEMNLRSPLLLALQNIGTVYTYHSSGVFNYIETKIVFSEPSPDVKYNYLILAQKTDPYPICHCSKVEKIWQIPGVIGYKIYD